MAGCSFVNRKIRIYNNAVDLPAAWDALAVTYFQTRAFLCHLEVYNSCEQLYYLVLKDDKAVAATVQYCLTLNLFTYDHWELPIQMHIIGIPCSVSANALMGEPAELSYLLENIFHSQRGFSLCLNAPSQALFASCPTGNTLPTTVFINNFHDFSDYLSCLRAAYRRRYKLIADHFRAVTKVPLAAMDFSEDMYQLYLDVLARSKGKLETLKFDFFSHLPDPFRLFAFYDQDKLLGWYITCHWKGKFDFFLGGIDYNLNEQYQTYKNILYQILDDGISTGAAEINLGQTAEIPKLCTGARLVPLYMAGYHSQPVINLLLKLGKKIFMYSEQFPEFRVLKKANYEGIVCPAKA